MVKALIVAIQDGIYINGYEKAFIDVGPERVPLYVRRFMGPEVAVTKRRTRTISSP